MPTLSLLLGLTIAMANPICPSKGQTLDIKDVCDAVTPRCFETPTGLKGSSHPEAMIQELFSRLSDEEIQARLVFAESLATQPECIQGAQREAIPQGIAWTLSNRIRDPKKRYGPSAREVLFKKGQFRSSFGGCDVATRTQLLCPSSAGEGWQELWLASTQAVRRAQSAEGNPMPEVRHYFFGEHFKNSQDQCKKWHGVMPAWSNPPNRRVHPELPGLDRASKCAMFYDVKE